MENWTREEETPCLWWVFADQGTSPLCWWPPTRQSTLQWARMSGWALRSDTADTGHRSRSETDLKRELSCHRALLANIQNSSSELAESYQKQQTSSQNAANAWKDLKKYLNFCFTVCLSKHLKQEAGGHEDKWGRRPRTQRLLDNMQTQEKKLTPLTGLSNSISEKNLNQGSLSKSTSSGLTSWAYGPRKRRKTRRRKGSDRR